jgi:hypothetical protein
MMVAIGIRIRVDSYRHFNDKKYGGKFACYRVFLVLLLLYLT